MCHTILLVDDDLSLLSSLSLYLSAQGFQVESFNNVDSSLQFLDIQQPDIIISDIVMPKQDGYKLLNAIKENFQSRNIPFIFLSAKGMTQDRILGYNAGCHAYLIKPFDPEELLAIINNLLSHSQNDLINKIEDENIDYLTIKHNNKPLLDFTFREQTVLKFLLQGMTNKEIAVQLSVSLRNIEKYVSRLLSKTGTRNRTELTQYCFQNNIKF